MEEYEICDDITQGSKYKHGRTIIHIDLDCFYAQVEMLKNPDLSTKPVGIKQQHYVITSNYVAREYGIRKCMLITEALALCPKLVIINGEDLHDYRIMSNKVTDVIKQFSKKVEKLGLDENFVDVSDLVSSKLSSSSEQFTSCVVGHTFNNQIEYDCRCGCKERITVGSHIASEIRSKIKEQLGMTCCAGIAHNKLLAKLVGPTHKPNQQTTIFPCSAISLVSSLNSIRSIPGVGRRTRDILDELGISSVSDVQNASLTELEKHLGRSLADWVKKACFGVDDSEVKESGMQQVIGLEEASKMINSLQDVKKRLLSLIERGMLLLEEDGRCPTTIRVTVRKYSGENYERQRESRQCAVNPSLFKIPVAKEQICEIALNLFKKLVDHTKPFHLTLIGLAFTKFQELPAKSSILQFVKQIDSKESNNNFNKAKDRCAVVDDCNSEECQSVENVTSDCKTNLSIYCNDGLASLSHSGNIDESVFNELPEDIKSEIKYELLAQENKPGTSNIQEVPYCPAGIDMNVFNELPAEIQNEIIKSTASNVSEAVKRSKTNKQKSILNYLKKK